jgi:hypothetical protein
LGNVSGRRRKRKKNFDRNAMRRSEIIRFARYTRAMEREGDRRRSLVAFVWHYPDADDLVWSVMYAGSWMLMPAIVNKPRPGDLPPPEMKAEPVSEAEACGIVDEALAVNPIFGCDRLAKFLGLTYDVRNKLKIRTIGSIDIKKRARMEIRRVLDKVKHENRRRAAGVLSRDEYEANSLSRTQPWKVLGMSRRTWERHRNKARDASVSAITYFSPKDGLATPAGGAGTSEWAFGPKEGKRTYVLADGDHDCCRQTYIGITSFIGRSGQKLARAA